LSQNTNGKDIAARLKADAEAIANQMVGLFAPAAALNVARA